MTETLRWLRSPQEQGCKNKIPLRVKEGLMPEQSSGENRAPLQRFQDEFLVGNNVTTKTTGMQPMLQACGPETHLFPMFL